MAPIDPAAVQEPGAWSSELGNLLSAVTPPWGDGPSSVLAQSIHQEKRILFFLHASFSCFVRWQGWMRPSLSPVQQQRLWASGNCYLNLQSYPTEAQSLCFTLLKFQSVWFPSICRSWSNRSEERKSVALWALKGQTAEHWARGACEQNALRGGPRAVGPQILCLWLRPFPSGKLFSENDQRVGNSVHIRVFITVLLKMLKTFGNTHNIVKWKVYIAVFIKWYKL